MRQFSVFRNEKWVDQIYGSKAEAKGWIKRHELNTHMGVWIKKPYGFEYATTIGVYYEFKFKDGAK